jgi:beta-lactamase regulating signal transducer with metallopeptidase domain
MAWMLYVLGTGTLLAVAALALDTLLRRAKLPTRWVWVAALGGIVALAVVAPRSDAPVSYRAARTTLAPLATLKATERDAGLLAQLASLRHRADGEIAHVMTTVQQRGESLAGPLALAWLVASGLLLSLLVIITRRADLVRIRWPRAQVRGVGVRVAPATGPAVIGVRRPDIVLPDWLMQRPEDEQHLVVLHEREHVAARDQLLPLGAWVVVALLPWHPAAWWCMSRLRLAIELDCDARVLHRGVHARPYGSLLIDIAGQCAGHRIGALALADRPSHLERRLLAMKQARSRIGIARASALLGTAALAVVMACEARIPTSAELDGMDVAAMERAAAKVTRLDGRTDSVRFYVNNLYVTESDAKALTAEQIATVNIAKTGASGLKEVRIMTNDAERLASKLVPLAQKGSVTLSDQPEKRILLSKTPRTGAAPLVYINGKLSSEAGLAALKTDAIESVEVVKGATAGRLYGESAATTGVIVVKTKAP